VRSLLRCPVKEVRIEIKVWLPSGDRIRLRGYLDDLQVDRDFMDVTTSFDVIPVYRVGGSRFTLKGRTFPWRKDKKENPWAFLSSQPESHFASRSRRAGVRRGTGPS
jgi:hypothetical protein